MLSGLSLFRDGDLSFSWASEARACSSSPRTNVDPQSSSLPETRLILPSQIASDTINVSPSRAQKIALHCKISVQYKISHSDRHQSYKHGSQFTEGPFLSTFWDNTVFEQTNKQAENLYLTICQSGGTRGYNDDWQRDIWTSRDWIGDE